MRTRSQPASPGGFVSLETERATRRSTRITRSASRAASQEPSSQQPTESSTQAAAQTKSQRVIKKPTTRKKATSSTTASNTTPTTTSATGAAKTQTRKAPKRGTRKTTRKTAKESDSVPPEGQEPDGENPLDTTRAENEYSAENPNSGPTVSDPALLESRESRESPTPLSPSQIPLPPSPSLSPSPSPLSPSPSPSPSPRSIPSPSKAQESQAPQEADDTEEQQIERILNLQQEYLDFSTFQDLQAHEVPFEPGPLEDLDDLLFNLPDLGETPCPAWYDLDDEELGQLECAVSERSVSPDPLSRQQWRFDLNLSDEIHSQTDDARESVVAQLEEELAAFFEESAECITPAPVVVEASTTAEAVPSTSEQVKTTEPTAVEPKELEQSRDEVAVSEESASQQETPSPLAPAVDSEGLTTVEDVAVVELAERFAKLSFDTAPCLSSEAAVPSESTTVPVWQPETELVSENRPTATLSAVPDIASDRQPALVSGAPADTPSLASIYDDVPPSVPVLTVFAPPKRVPLPPTLFLTPIPDSPSSIYDDGQAPPSHHSPERKSVEDPLVPVVLEEAPELIPGPPLCRSRVTSRERRLSRSQRRRQVFVPQPTPLSPIPEERDVDPGASSSVGPEGVSPNPEALVASSSPPSPIRPVVSIPFSPTLFSPSSVSPTPGTKTAQGTQETRIDDNQRKGSETKENMPKKPKKTRKKSGSKKALTTKKVNRKRVRTEASPEDENEPITPSANKRRNLGPPGSTPFRAHTPRLPNLPRIPYSERLRRRQAESQGRLHEGTLFRLPQYIAQTEADRLASEAITSANPVPERLPTNLDFSAEQTQSDDQVISEHSASTQEPSTPEPARRGWNIRGLLNSVPRSFSRFLPSFARTSERTEIPATQQPSFERSRRTEPSESDSSVVLDRESRPRRRLSEQAAGRRPRNLSYSLFPAPIDRSLYLGDAFTKPTTTAPTAPASIPASQPVSQEMPQTSAVHSDSTPQAADATAITTNASQKRKRSPSPDVIPNPAGCSYGMDLDYFCYSSESEDEEAEIPAPRTEPRRVDSLAKAALRSVVQSERPASKKVRFDASPEDTPSKRRARATDPYTGIHFIGMGNPQSSSPLPSSPPTTPTPEIRVVDPRSQPGFIPNTTGTFQLDYDAFSDDSDSSGAPSPPRTAAFSTVTEPPTVSQSATSLSPQLPTPHATPRAAQPPSTPARIDEEALARARSQAEKYKPKTPSGLRTASRYLSPLTATPDITPEAPAAPASPTAPTPATETITEEFGDDKFARDAQWLYEHCPSGDLSQLVWPKPTSLVETLGISNEAVRIMNDIWDESAVDQAYPIFKQGLEELKQSLA
ncbi:uncharacterized protein BJX67DRAFT_385974 [Aspergillus lucknowensis]|uniref:Structure-specific endonuclease subunit SLX4 n=1 Tax=Aspergillus lucknowensis TaxID=176173 RepID=A0ABR4L9D1_9EURO